MATGSAARLRRLPTSELEQAASVLASGDILQIAQVTHRLETDLGYPVDLEWAFARGELFVLQARPITTSQAVDN